MPVHAQADDDALTICGISLLAWIVANVSHEGLGHALVALATGAPSGVLSTVAWSSAQDTRLVAAAGTLVNLLEAGVLLLALRGAKNAPAAARFFLFACAAFNLFTGTGYFFFSGVSGFGDWADVVAGLSPQWVWRGLLIVGGAASYFCAMLVLGVSLVRYVGVEASDTKRLRRLTLVPYFSAVALSLAASALNPLGWQLVLESALPAAAGGNCGLIWLWHYGRGAQPIFGSQKLGRSYGWLAAAGAFSLVFIFVLGRGITLHR